MVVREEKRKLIRNYGSLGPIELWAFERAAESLLADVEWDDEQHGPRNVKDRNP